MATDADTSTGQATKTAEMSGTLGRHFQHHLELDEITAADKATAVSRFEAVARSVRDVLAERWIQTEKTYQQQNPKRAYYLSMEFLIGRSLGNNVLNLALDPAVKDLVGERDLDWLGILETEAEAGLGNGGLGRLAACFLDSMATLQLPGMGYGLRYEYGIFRQMVEDGWQREVPDNWLRQGDPWEVMRPLERVEVSLNCSFEIQGRTFRVIPDRPCRIVGIPYDRPIIGFGGGTVNTLRLWGARAAHSFDFKEFSNGDFVGAMADSLAAESLTRLLYPDDSTISGQALRFAQEYFLVACSLADLVRRFRNAGGEWIDLGAKAAIQMNDTHPSMAVPELMRILLDEGGLTWEQAWTVTCRTLAYTNHTLLPEALEKWPLQWFEVMLPRQTEIILEINQRLLDTVRARFPGDNGRLERVSLIDDSQKPKIRMANLAIVGSHSTNGVAEIHSRLLRTTTVKDLAEVFPERFNNKTNGITPRRWLLLANPALASTISDAIGDGWITDLDQLQRLRPLAGDRGLQDAFGAAKLTAKRRFVQWLDAGSNVRVDPDSIFDCQVKRIHEYKRQFLNALRVVVLYNRLRQDPSLEMLPRTFFFSGKAAPSYTLAKIIIKFIGNLAKTIEGDPRIGDRLKVVFLPDYSVSLAERLIPATDLSNQISTAGFEASGTSNMKFMLNGALTIGTRDGATIEMAEEAGEENFFLFGLNVAEVAASRQWYDPHWHYENEPETRAALDMIFSGHFNKYEPEIFNALRDMLLTQGDRYMHLADLQSYLVADRNATALYTDQPAWRQRAILNVSASGKFSSDRVIAEYARDIWDVSPCPVIRA